MFCESKGVCQHGRTNSFWLRANAMCVGHSGLKNGHENDKDPVIVQLKSMMSGEKVDKKGKPTRTRHGREGESKYRWGQFPNFKNLD